MLLLKEYTVRNGATTFSNEPRRAFSKSVRWTIHHNRSGGLHALSRLLGSLYITHLELKQALSDRIRVGNSAIVEHGDTSDAPAQQTPGHIAAQCARA